MGCQVYDASLLPDFPDDAAASLDDGSAPDTTADRALSSCDTGGPCLDATGGRAGAGGSTDSGDLDSSADSARDAGTGGARSSDATGEGGSRTVADASDARCTGSCVSDASIDVDNCPNDPAKTQPGRCGCGTPDTDGDGDGTPDCLDGCPADASKTQAGVCGCGKQDPPDGGGGAAYCFKDSMIHRYAFNGTGTVATDSVGTADGSVQGGTNARQSGGVVALSGDLNSAGYAGEGFVALPSNILSGLTNATFEAWVTWDGAGRTGGTAWQRIFDIGDQTGTGSSAVGRTYLFVSASAGTTGGPLRAAYTTNGTTNETLINASSGALPTGTRKHIALVVDDPNNTMSLYLDGAVVGFVQLNGVLASINDNNCWLGRSQFAVDPEFNGSLDEFRIYNVALSATQVQSSFAAGPNPVYLP
jgi:hypothetical protein